MRLVRVVAVLLFALASIAFAKENKLGISETNRVTFDTAVRIGTELLPAGEYVVHHTMEGQDHVMVFQRLRSKQEYKVKCTLVAVPKKIEKDQNSYQVNANNERVLLEMQFRGDLAKHVF